MSLLLYSISYVPYVRYCSWRFTMTIVSLERSIILKNIFFSFYFFDLEITPSRMHLWRYFSTWKSVRKKVRKNVPLRGKDPSSSRKMAFFPPKVSLCAFFNSTTSTANRGEKKEPSYVNKYWLKHNKKIVQ